MIFKLLVFHFALLWTSSRLSGIALALVEYVCFFFPAYSRTEFRFTNCKQNNMKITRKEHVPCSKQKYKIQMFPLQLTSMSLNAGRVQLNLTEMDVINLSASRWQGFNSFFPASQGTKEVGLYSWNPCQSVRSQNRMRKSKTKLEKTIAQQTKQVKRN